MENTNNVVAFKPREKHEDSDLFSTGAHLVSALRDEFESHDLMTKGLSFSFDMLLYSLKQKDRA